MFRHGPSLLATPYIASVKDDMESVNHAFVPSRSRPPPALATISQNVKCD